MKKIFVVIVSISLMAIIIGTGYSQEDISLNQNPETNASDTLFTPNGTDNNLNTTYGSLAGFYLTDDAKYNSLFGAQAGYRIETGDNNTLLGCASGWYLTDQVRNTFVGYESGLLSRGNDNTIIGHQAGKGGSSNWNSGGGNTFVGSGAGGNNDTGEYNTFVGMAAGKANTEGKWNTFVGHEAGASNTTASSNTFVGDAAGKANTIGHHNTFLGDAAGTRNIGGSSNTFLGENAGYKNEEGADNVFIGRQAGETNGDGDQNIFVGRSAGYANTIGSYNVLVGFEAGINNVGGQYNTFVGMKAGHETIGGSSNTFLGDYAGYANTDGMRNVFIGNEAGRNESGSDRLFIDNSNTATPLIWGDFANNNVVIYGGFRSIASYGTSDARLKKNIAPLTSSLDKISELQGVTFEWKNAEWLSEDLKKAKQIGLLAQDVEKELPELVSEDKDGYKAVSYSKLTAVLVEAVKELKAQNERQQAEIEKLRAMIKNLES